MESESKAKLHSQRQKMGHMSISWRKKKSRKRNIPLGTLGFGYYLGRNRLQHNHTDSQCRSELEVQFLVPRMQLRGPCPLEICGPLRPQTSTGNPTHSCTGWVLYWFLLHDCSSRGDSSRLGPSPSSSAHSLAPHMGFTASAGLLDGGTDQRRRERRWEPMAMMMSCAGSPGSVIHQTLSTTHPCSYLEKKKKTEIFFFSKSHLLASSIPLLNANSNVNTHTLIKNMWEENANLLFCNLPQGTRCWSRNK